jgi:protoporphyrinogen oxidase
MARIQEPRQRSPFAAPTSQTSLMLEIPCDVGDAIWTASDEDIYERCLSDLADLGFQGLQRATIDHFSTYVEEGYPIYHLDYQADRRRVLAFTQGTANVTTCGRQGGFRYIFMDTAMEMGIAAARALVERSDARAVCDLGSERGLIEARALTA